jgi:hypothetical protein
MMAENVVVEWAPFTVKEGVEDADLLAASEALQSEFLSHQPGFVGRELLKGQNGQWVDLAVWRSKADAERAVANAATSPVCHRYFQLMVDADHADTGAGVLHLERIRVYGRDGDGGAGR